MTLFALLILLDALLMWAILTSPRGWWVVKLAAILTVSAANFLAIHAYASGAGWAVSKAPANAEFVSCWVVEPALDGDHPGAIYLWAVPVSQHPVLGYRSLPSEPRSYRLPYSRALHAQCVKQSKRRAGQQGLPIMVGKRKARGAHLAPSALHFYRLPPPSLPPKEKS